MYTMFLNLPLIWYTLHALSKFFGCRRRARLGEGVEGQASHKTRRALGFVFRICYF